jgi:hypothetical protein
VDTSRVSLVIQLGLHLRCWRLRGGFLSSLDGWRGSQGRCPSSFALPCAEPFRRRRGGWRRAPFCITRTQWSPLRRQRRRHRLSDGRCQPFGLQIVPGQQWRGWRGGAGGCCCLRHPCFCNLQKTHERNFGPLASLGCRERWGDSKLSQGVWAPRVPWWLIHA